MKQSVNGKTTREPRTDGTDRTKYFWWKNFDDDERLAHELCSTIRFLSKHQDNRLNQLTNSTRLYGNSTAYNQLGTSFSRVTAASSTPSNSRISFNLCSSAIDTLTAQIAKNKVVPTFITSGGIWGMQRKAEKLSKFIEGIFYEQDAHEKLTYQTRDSGIWGDGILHPYRDANNRVAIERRVPHEFLVDLVESAVLDVPKQLHTLKVADRDSIIDLYPEHEEAIRLCGPANFDDTGGDPTAANLICISESWHLKSGPKAKDGMKVITLPDSSVILDKEEYKKDFYPFVILPYSKRAIGFWGQGACERLQNIQGEINRLMIAIQRAMWMGAGYKILSHVNDRVPTQHFTNDITSIIKWSGAIKPEFITPAFIQAEISPYIDSLIAKGMQQEGISQMQSANMKPQGIDSGAALRTYDQIADDRQLFFAQRVEGAALELARQCIEVVKDIAADTGGSYKAKFPNTNFIETIDWAEIDLKEDEWWLKAFPTSELPEEPAAKLAAVQEYAQAGFISPRTARRLMRMPDIEMADALANAAEDLICKMIEDILYDGKNSRPDGEMDLVLARSVALEYMNYAKLNDCPPKRIAMLRTWMGYLSDEQGLTAPPMLPMMPGAAPGQAAPMANPEPTPTSNMIPNIAGAA
jgi:hypothetical protein